MRVVLNICLALRGRISFDGQCWLVCHISERQCHQCGVHRGQMRTQRQSDDARSEKGRKPIQPAVFVEQSNAMVGLNPGGRLRLLRMFEHIYANP